MSPEEVREAFSEAFEDDLDPARKEAFETALREDEELRQEYADFVETLSLVSRIGDEEAEPAPDLLAGVQERLRKRSKGRYYRDRFAQRAGPGWTLPVLLLMVCVLVLATAWYALHSTVVLDDTPTAPTTER